MPTPPAAPLSGWLPAAPGRPRSTLRGPKFPDAHVTRWRRTEKRHETGMRTSMGRRADRWSDRLRRDRDLLHGLRPRSRAALAVHCRTSRGGSVSRARRSGAVRSKTTVLRSRTSDTFVALARARRRCSSAWRKAEADRYLTQSDLCSIARSTRRATRPPLCRAAASNGFFMANPRSRA